MDSEDLATGDSAGIAAIGTGATATHITARFPALAFARISKFALSSGVIDGNGARATTEAACWPFLPIGDLVFGRALFAVARCGKGAVTPRLPTNVSTGLPGERGLDFNVIRFAGGVEDRSLGGLLVRYLRSAAEAALDNPRCPYADAALALSSCGPVRICSQKSWMMLATLARNRRALFARP